MHVVLYGADIAPKQPGQHSTVCGRMPRTVTKQRTLMCSEHTPLVALYFASTIGLSSVKANNVTTQHNTTQPPTVPNRHIGSHVRVMLCMRSPGHGTGAQAVHPPPQSPLPNALKQAITASHQNPLAGRVHGTQLPPTGFVSWCNTVGEPGDAAVKGLCAPLGLQVAPARRPCVNPPSACAHGLRRHAYVSTTTVVVSKPSHPTLHAPTAAYGCPAILHTWHGTA